MNTIRALAGWRSWRKFIASQPDPYYQDRAREAAQSAFVIFISGVALVFILIFACIVR